MPRRTPHLAEILERWNAGELQEEIAAALGMKPNAVHMAISRAREAGADVRPAKQGPRKGSHRANTELAVAAMSTLRANGWSDAEIAAALKISRGYVEIAIERAKKDAGSEVPAPYVPRGNITAPPSHDRVRRVVLASRSFAEAAERLGMSITWTQKQAKRLGVRTQFRYGIEKLPPDDQLKAILADARSVECVAKRFGVTDRIISAKAAQLGIDCRLKVRAGLPDDETLWQDLFWCSSFREVAERYGVDQSVIRNQAKRLGIASPSKRGRMPVAASLQRLRA